VQVQGNHVHVEYQLLSVRIGLLLEGKIVELIEKAALVHESLENDAQRRDMLVLVLQDLTQLGLDGCGTFDLSLLSLK
jgi:hypothetical protein